MSVWIPTRAEVAMTSASPCCNKRHKQKSNKIYLVDSLLHRIDRVPDQLPRRHAVLRIQEAAEVSELSTLDERDWLHVGDHEGTESDVQNALLGGIARVRSAPGRVFEEVV